MREQEYRATQRREERQHELTMMQMLLGAAGTKRRSQVTGHRSQVTGHRSQVTGHRSQVTGHRSQKI